MKRWCAPIIAGAVLAAAPTQFAAAAPKLIGKFKSWVAVQDGKKRGKTCYVHAEPSSMKGRYKKRGHAFVEVIHVPAENRRNEVLFTSGYTFKADGTVKVDIGGRRFVLYTDKDLAWTASVKDDHALVRAMRRGRRMVVRGRSWRGTLTTDTYSLLGFTAALRVASAACKVGRG